MQRFTQVKQKQMLTGGLEHFTVSTPASIVPTADPDAVYNSQEFHNFYEQARVWEQMIEIFRTRGNVVIVSELAAGGFTLAVEKTDAVDAAEMQAKIRELGEVAFGEVDDNGDMVPATVDLSAVVVAKVDYDLL